MSDRTSSSDEPTETSISKPLGDDTLYVTLPEHLRAEIDRRVADTDFDSADEYVTFVLESLFRELDNLDDDVPVNVRDEEQDDTDSIQNRLESLGYL